MTSTSASWTQRPDVKLRGVPGGKTFEKNKVHSTRSVSRRVASLRFRRSINKTTLSCPMSCPVLCCLALSCLVLSCPSPVLFCHVLFCLVLSWVRSYQVLSCLFLSCPESCLVLSVCLSFLSVLSVLSALSCLSFLPFVVCLLCPCMSFLSCL